MKLSSLAVVANLGSTTSSSRKFNNQHEYRRNLEDRWMPQVKSLALFRRGVVDLVNRCSRRQTRPPTSFQVSFQHRPILFSAIS
jgi:hypothetical protein